MLRVNWNSDAAYSRHTRTPLYRILCVSATPLPIMQDYVVNHPLQLDLEAPEPLILRFLPRIRVSLVERELEDIGPR